MSAERKRTMLRILTLSVFFSMAVSAAVGRDSIDLPPIIGNGNGNGNGNTDGNSHGNGVGNNNEPGNFIGNNNNGKNNIGGNNGLRNSGVDNGNDNMGSNNGNDNGGSNNGNGNRGDNNGNNNGQGNQPSGNRLPLPPVRLEVKQRPSTNKRLLTSKSVNPTTRKLITRRPEVRPDESNDRPTPDIPDESFTTSTTDLPDDYYRNRRYFDWRAYLQRLFRNYDRNDNDRDYNYRNYRPWNYQYQPGSTRHWSSYA